MITEFFDDTEKGWSAVLACVKILARDGHPIKISKDENGFLLFQYTYEDNKTLEWIVIEPTANPECISFEEEK